MHIPDSEAKELSNLIAKTLEHHFHIYSNQKLAYTEEIQTIIERVSKDYFNKDLTISKMFS